MWVATTGGLLVQLASALRPKQLTGIEPASHSRERALFRLRTLAPTVVILPPERWAEVPASSVDIVTCHEVLHLVEDLPSLFGNIARVLRTRGSAFIVVGCHTENPVWKAWSAKLRDSGQTVFDRTAFDILRTGIAAGLHGALRPLRRDGWIIYNPDNTVFKYPSTRDLLDHQYRNKLLFRFPKAVMKDNATPFLTVPPQLATTVAEVCAVPRRGKSPRGDGRLGPDRT